MITDWPDWRGKRAVVIATGPSLTAEQLELVAQHREGLKVMAINDAGLEPGPGRAFSAPFRDVHYAADSHFWQKHQPAAPLRIVAKAAEDRAGIWAIRHGLADAIALCHRNPIELNFPGHVFNGAHSGIQALQLAVLFGARQVFLLGFDCRVGKRQNYCDKASGLARQWKGDSRQWAAQYARISWPVEIFNCSPGSAIECFPRLRIEDVLR